MEPALRVLAERLKLLGGDYRVIRNPARAVRLRPEKDDLGPHDRGAVGGQDSSERLRTVGREPVVSHRAGAARHVVPQGLVGSCEIHGPVSGALGHDAGRRLFRHCPLLS